MQENILLGFLLDGPQTGYQIRKSMESKTDLFFNTSPGSINPAFKKLSQNGMATAEECVENGRRKKIYTITDKGRDHFYHWMNSKVERMKIKREILLRIFFFSKISEENRDAIVSNYLSSIEKYLGLLQTIRQRVKTDGSLTRFEQDTLQFGVDYYSFLVDWFRDYFSRLR